MGRQLLYGPAVRTDHSDWVAARDQRHPWASARYLEVAAAELRPCWPPELTDRSPEFRKRQELTLPVLVSHAIEDWLSPGRMISLIAAIRLRPEQGDAVFSCAEFYCGGPMGPMLIIDPGRSTRDLEELLEFCSQVWRGSFAQPELGWQSEDFHASFCSLRASGVQPLPEAPGRATG